MAFVEVEAMAGKNLLSVEVSDFPPEFFEYFLLELPDDR